MVSSPVLVTALPLMFLASTIPDKRVKASPSLKVIDIQLSLKENLEFTFFPSFLMIAFCFVPFPLIDIL